MRERLQLGAPGVYPVPEEPVRALTGVRMDVAAFVGVAPRGPARLPALAAPWAVPPRGTAAPSSSLRSVAVPVESWDAYRRLFGGFEGPGLLPYSVAAFFEQGGRRAYVVRVVHDFGSGDPLNDAGTASGALPGVARAGGEAVTLRARNEGSWGNALRATLAWRTRPVAVDTSTPPTQTALTLPLDALLPAGTLLRLRLEGGTYALRFVTAVWDEWRADRPLRVRRATLTPPAGSVVDPVEAAKAVEGVESVEASVAVTDTARDGVERLELHEGLGLHPLHPRWLALALYRDSALVYPDAAWIGEELAVADPELRAPAEPAADPPQFSGGVDRYAAVTHEDFFDADWVPGDEILRDGVHALVEVEDLSLVVVPDLYSPRALVEPGEEEDVSAAGARFETCLEPVPAAPAEEEGDGSDEGLDGLRLDPADPAEREEIVGLQLALAELAEMLQSWIVLLDVPPGLHQREALEWRARFGTAWAAAYHPWLRVSRPDDARSPLVEVGPAAFAAGIVARQEGAFGVQHGPANVLAVGPVSLTDRVSPARHDELHQSGINVYLAERDGIRLTAGRTLSRDPVWRQLSVRRLVTMLRRVLLRQMQWTVFEPNDARLRDELRRMLEGYLGQLFRANAFRGRTPDEAFFVRCDEELNPPQVLDAGQLVCHVGIAPAEPLEFIVLRLAREGDGTLLTEE